MASRADCDLLRASGSAGVQPWTAYELVGQAQRSLHHFWPRSEAHLYAELKRLVDRGHADAEVVEGRRRQRTRYTITPRGRAALEDWLGTEPAPAYPRGRGSCSACCWVTREPAKDLRAALETTARQVRDLSADGVALTQELLATGGPFPQRLHLTERVVSFYGESSAPQRWCDETLAEVETWPDTRDIGLTPQGRERLERLLARVNPYTYKRPDGRLYSSD